jgi:ankyrin repeat protein
MARHRPSAWGCEHATPWTDWNKLSINRRDSPLHAAATYGLSKTLGFLLNNRGYRKDILNNFGETALQRAAQLGTTRAMDVLLAHGADLDAKVKQHYFNDANLLILATHCCQVDAVQVLLNHGISANTYDPKYLTFPLHLAASTHTKLTQLLLNYGATVDFPGKSPCYPETFMTSLHFAVFNAHVFNAAHERVNLLLDRGANINCQSMTGNTPLHMALLGGHDDLVLLLLQRGANVGLRNKQGKSALQLARERGFFSSKEDSDPPEALSKLKDIPQLHSAVWSRDHPRVCELLGRGYDMEQKDQEGSTVWDYCIGRADIELAKLLADYMEEHQLSRRKEIGNAAFETALKSMTSLRLHRS